MNRTRRDVENDKAKEPHEKEDHAKRQKYEPHVCLRYLAYNPWLPAQSGESFKGH
jgi:hypothetical protein